MVSLDINDESVLAAIAAGALAQEYELVNRARITSSVTVLEVSGDSDSATFPNGSIALVAGARTSEIFGDIRAAAERADAVEVARLLDALQSPHKTRRAKAPGTVDETVNRLRKIPVITEVAYHGKLLTRGLALTPPNHAAATVVVFAGGRIDSAGVEAAHACTTKGRSMADEIDTLFLVRQPTLSDIEKELLDRLPEREINAAVAPPCLAAGVFTAAATLTSGAFPFLDWALQENVRLATLGGTDWPPLDVDPQAGVDANVSRWLESPDHADSLDGLEPRAAIESLVRLRARILAEGGRR
jgi:hypothetical protein